MSTANWERQALVLSMCGPVFNRIKMCFEYPQKNCDLALHADAKNFINLLGEQVLPQWCKKNMNDGEAINVMHNLMFLFAYKTHQVFQARVIHQIIDQNWDLKGFKATLMRIIQKLGLSGLAGTTNLEKYLEKMINSQNLQSTSCIKAIGSFLRNHKKSVNEDDLSNPIKTYQSSFEFLKQDIQRYREQNIKHECF